MTVHAGKLMGFRLNQTVGSFSTKQLGFRENNQNQSPERKQNCASSALLCYFRSQHFHFNSAVEERQEILKYKIWYFSCLLQCNTCSNGTLLVRFLKRQGHQVLLSSSVASHNATEHSPLVVSLALFCLKFLCYHIIYSLRQLLGPGSETSGGSGKSSRAL